MLNSKAVSCLSDLAPSADSPKQELITLVTLVHLSDIHFSERDDLSQFDINQQIRRALVEDLAVKPADGAGYDAVLVTGDIAFSGKQEEYKRAQQWLDEVFIRTGLSPSDTYTIPGNHDIDRGYVEPQFPLWDSHVRLRETADPVIWRDVIATQLQRDPLHTMLAPLTGYNDFAQGYECRTEHDKLAWRRTLTKTLEDGRLVRLHGLNSALISDAADAPGKLLVSDFQTSHLEHAHGVVEIAMCHHPPDWLMDKAAVRDVLRTFTPIALFGHEHSTRITMDAKQMQLFAGAVQPSRRDAGDWLPTYHILQLSVAKAGDAPQLVIRVHTREFDKQKFKFRARRGADEQPFEEHRLGLKHWTPEAEAVKIQVASGAGPALSSKESSEMPAADAVMSTSTETAQRDLLVYFFRLRTPERYAAANEAGLLRDGDDTLQPQAMWAEVFRRAIAERQALTKFWDAVASRTPELKEVSNPFAR